MHLTSEPRWKILFMAGVLSLIVLSGSLWASQQQAEKPGQAAS
jgi:hypothetical protein